ncbi:MAG: LapA family protein [Desulfobacterales bacterium]|nr:LapA family protein [Desulfobacterales bacterium]
MKKVKIALWVIVLGFIALIVYQNLSYFTAKQNFNLNLMFAEYKFPGIENYILFIICLLVGFILAFFFGLSERMKAKKNIKNLQITVDSYLEKISTLKSELETIKSSSVKKASPDIKHGPADVSDKE